MLKRVLSTIVAIALLLTMACFVFADNVTALTVNVSNADLRPGDKVTATVQLNNYADNWSAMSVDVSYPTALFELEGTVEESILFDGFLAGESSEESFAQIYERGEGVYRIVWMAPQNVEIEGSEPIDLVTMKLVAKGDVQGAGAIQARLIEDGQLSVDENDVLIEVPASGGTFSTATASGEVAIDGIPWSEQPVLRAEIDKTRIQLNRTAVVTLYIDRYDPWSTLSVDLAIPDIPDKCAEISNVELLGFQGEAVVSGNNITVTAAGDVAGEGYLDESGTLLAMKVTLKGLALHDEFDLAPSFAEGKQVSSTYGTMTGEVHYDADPASLMATVVPDKTDLEVKLDLGVDELGNPKTSVAAGQTFDVTVNLKEHENEWAAFTILGTYDPSMFEVVEIVTYANGYDEVIKPVELTDNLEFVWLSTGNIKTDITNPTLLKITFRAIQATTAESISFAFEKNGVIAEDESGNLGVLEEDVDFTGEDKEVSVEVLPTPMHLETKTQDAQGNPLTSVKAGKTFDVIVSVHDCYEKLAALSFEGTFDTNQFELVGVTPLLDNFGANGSAIYPDSAELIAECNADGEVELVWIGTDNVKLAPEFDAVRLTFMAKEQADAAAIQFGFIESGILQVGSDGIPAELAKGTYYVEEQAAATVEITAPKVMLELRTEAQNIKAGDSFTVEVWVVDYYSPLAAISVELALDETKYNVNAATPEILAGIEAIQDEEGALQFVWAHWENIRMDTQEFKVLTLEIEALRSTDDATDDIKAVFIDGGMVRVDGSGTVNGLEGGVDYAHPVNEPAIVTVPVAQKPVELEVTLNNAGTVEAGEEFTVTVDLSKYYEGNWASIGIAADFLADDFEVVDAVVASEFDGVFSWTKENENGKSFVAAWVGVENIPDPPAMTLTLRAKETAEIDALKETISFYFVPEATYTCVDSATLQYVEVASDGSAYDTNPVTCELDIIEAETTVQVNISFGSMEFTYNYGDWNVETHVWDGAGWECEEDANRITVENIGSVGISAGFEFTKNGEIPYDLTNLSGAFTYEDAPLIGEIGVTVGGPAQNVLFALSGKTEQAWEDQQIVGEITVTITADGAIDEEVTQ